MPKRHSPTPVPLTLVSRTVALLALMLCVLVAAPLSAHAATFNPALVISDDNMRAYESMSQADIQAFLGAQTGVLKSLVTTDYAGVRKPASQIIYEACRQWHISPRVMLVMLQKEQSLLTRTTLKTGYSGTLDWAIGMGCPDSGTRIEKYRGFGNQMWYGAMRLDGYGEGKNGSTVPLYFVGMSYKAGSTTIYPANLATYKLYVYNPSIGASAPYGDLSSQAGSLSGNANFWYLYWKYFGDPFGNARAIAVYRFQRISNGSYYYTASQAERYRLITRSSRSWRYQGRAFSWDTTASSTPTRPANTIVVYRFYDRVKRHYIYTGSTTKIARYRSARYAKRYRFDGAAWQVSPTPTGATQVYSILHKRTGTYLYTTSAADKKKYAARKYRSKYKYTGSFYVTQ